MNKPAFKNDWLGGLVLNQTTFAKLLNNLKKNFN